MLQQNPQTVPYLLGRCQPWGKCADYGLRADYWNLLEGEQFRFFFFFFCKRKLLCKPGQNYSIKNGHRKAVQQQFQELVCENLHFLCVKSSHFFCHSELLISGIRSVILQFGNHLNIWQRNHVACGVSRKLLHWIEIMNVFFLKNVTELIHHNFKERWLLWRTGDKVCHSWTSTCQTASKKKKKKIHAFKAKLTCI